MIRCVRIWTGEEVFSPHAFMTLDKAQECFGYELADVNDDGEVA